MTLDPKIMEAVTEAAIEYRAQKKGAHKSPKQEDPTVTDAFARGHRLEQIGVWMCEAANILLGAQVALGCGDDDLTHDCLSRLALVVKMLINTWNLDLRRQRELADSEAKEAAE